ncbi:unnamed protein product [Caenorhabditis angaria]|uniref:Phospholipase A2 domain-containing protein n=1 Tax=Caenorhabditis angaria TaxID=860376 RepID=A0A9P1ILV4_9PELO|nr:unnamed protein product [Caenorhabditis angaria]
MQLFLLICLKFSGTISFFLTKADVPEWMLPILEKNWYCGSGRTEYFARKVAKLYQMAPSAMYSYNHCCAVHDDCYDQQLGKEWCDQTFDACNWLISTQLAEKHIYPTYVWSLGAGLAVKLFGGGPYKEAGRTKVIPYNPSQNKKIKMIYPLIFKHCPLQIATFSSCAMQFDLCSSRNLSHCEHFLQSCLHFSRAQRDTKNPDYSCDCAVRAVQLSIDIPYYSEKRNDIGLWEVIKATFPIQFSFSIFGYI